MAGRIWMPENSRLVQPHRFGLGQGRWPASGVPVLSPPATMTFWGECDDASYPGCVTYNVNPTVRVWVDLLAFATPHDLTILNVTYCPTMMAGGPAGYKYLAMRNDNFNAGMANSGAVPNGTILGDTDYVVWTIARVNSIGAASDNADGSCWNNESLWGDTVVDTGCMLKKTGPRMQSYVYSGGAQVAPVGGSAFALNTWMLVRQRHQGGNVYQKVGSAGVEVSVPAGVGGGVKLMAGYCDGGLSVLMACKAPSPADVLVIDTYLAAKYGL